jgi:cytochrome c-type biogenesis protein CcmH
MSALFRLTLPFVFFLIVNNVCAYDEPVKFNNIEHEERYQALIEEIRCLVCQNQSLADSNADLAQDLRKEVYDMIVAGKQDEQIITFLVERYGDFVMYRPPLKENTWLLWFGPFLLLSLALIIAIIVIRKQSSSDYTEPDMDDNQKQRLAELLNEEPGKNKGKDKE